MNGRILSYSSESIQNLQAIKAFDLTRRYTSDFRVLIDRYRKVRLAHDKFSVLLTLAMSVIGLLVSYACYGWGVWRLWQGAISYGTMTLFLQLSGSLTAAFSSLVSLAPSAISIATAAGRIKQITDLPMEQDADEEAACAMVTADAWGFVSQLPEGLDTRIGERGVNFSEGQIQRISIARAVLRQAPVLIMDEATSALDSETEERVLKALMASDPRRTCILTTHRPSMLRYCTRVYRLNEQGNLIKETNDV